MKPGKSFKSNDTKRILILCQNPNDEFEKALHEFISLNLNSKRQITVLVYKKKPEENFKSILTDKEIILTRKSLNIIGLPNKKHLANLFNESFDIILGLQKSHNPIFNYIIKSIPASFRIGFHFNGSEVIFDIMVKATGNWQKDFRTLQEYMYQIEK